MPGFQRQYLFGAKLVLTTGLHIGGGEAGLSASDSPVVRAPDGQPFIPGSSFRGAFRSTVEKLALTVGLGSCGLLPDQGCPGAQGDEQRRLNEQRRKEGWNDVDLLRHLANGIDLNGQMVRLCDTCSLFGSSYSASRISFSDLYLVEDADAIVQVRDGVAIDRDSERQVEGLLYDYEVVAPSTTFSAEVLLEEPTDTDLRLTCVGLSEFLNGFVALGGKRSAGLGRCRLTDLGIYELDLTTGDVADRARRLRCYLLGKTSAEKMTRVSDAAGFIDAQIRFLLA